MSASPCWQIPNDYCRAPIRSWPTRSFLSILRAGSAYGTRNRAPAAISLTEEGHQGKTYDLVSSKMLTGPDAATTWSKLPGKEITYAGHGDFDDFEAQLRRTGGPMRNTGTPSWLAYDLRLMFQGFVERGFSNTEDQTERFAALLGHQPRTYSSYAEELATEWAAA